VGQGFSFASSPNRGERRVEVADLSARLLGVVAELLLQLRSPCVILEVSEPFDDVFFLHLQRGAQLVGEELARRRDAVEHGRLLVSVGGHLAASPSRCGQTRFRRGHARNGEAHVR
jgi:hypothetical protein